MTLRHLARSLVVPMLGLAALAVAAEFGTAAEAKAMLEKAAAALKANQASALATFQK